MLLFEFSFVIFVTLSLQFVKAVDYCSLPGCHDRHIACRNNGSFASNCPSNAKLVDMNAHREHILGMFNSFRNHFAGGREEPFPKAGRMAQMKWCPELEYLAQLNVKTCRSQYDKCRGTKHFPFAGQSIAMKSYTGEENSYTDDELVKDSIEHWFDEQRYATLDMIYQYPSYEPHPSPAHFTIAINEKNSDIGCAAVRFSKDFYHYFIFACDFSVGNLPGYPIYTYSNYSSTECKNRYGASNDFPNLCHPKEIYRYNVYSHH